MKNVMRDIPWRRFWLVAQPYWVSSEKGTACLRALAVLTLMGTNIGLQVVNNSVAGRVARAIRLWQLHDVAFYVILSLLLLVLQLPVQVYYNILRTRIALMWRKWLTTTLLHRWYDPNTKAYLWVTTNRQDVANPDQRMSQDPESFTNSTMGLLSALIEALAQIVTWAGVLLSLSYILTVSAIVCALVSSFAVTLIGKALVKLINQQMDAEAELRLSAGRARNSAGMLSLEGGAQLAETEALAKVSNVIDINLGILRVTRNIQFFTSGWNMLMPLVPLSIMVFMSRGPIDYEFLVRAGGAFSAFYNAANVFANQFGGLASYFAIINRLGVFCEAVDAADEHARRVKV